MKAISLADSPAAQTAKQNKLALRGFEQNFVLRLFRRVCSLLRLRCRIRNATKQNPCQASAIRASVSQTGT